MKSNQYLKHSRDNAPKTVEFKYLVKKCVSSAEEGKANDSRFNKRLKITVSQAISNLKIRKGQMIPQL